MQHLETRIVGEVGLGFKRLDRTANHVNKPLPKKFSATWILTSLTLLAFYLGFFHVCMFVEYPARIAVGIAFWICWALFCHVRRAAFLNRFEYAIHHAVGIDILLEGLNPFHDGYGFYGCAASFWSVLWFYRWYATVSAKTESD